LLELAAVELGPLAAEATLVGGCLVPLLITDPGAPSPRVTIDVDIVVQTVTLLEYSRFSAALRQRGFRQGDVEADPICRYRKGRLIIDALPVSPTVLGFGNQWYPLSVATAVPSRLPSGFQLRHATAPCFLATKLAAFRDRGRSDYLGSRDFEDIVAVVDGRPEVVDEVLSAPRELRNWLKGEAATLVGERGFVDGLSGMIPGIADIPGRAGLIMERFVAIARG